MTFPQPDFAAGSYDAAAVHRQGHAPVSYGNGDDAMNVRFYEREVELGFASQQAGRPIHETRVYVEMIPPGSNGKFRVDREAHDGDKRRFPRHWAAFEQNRKDPQIIGTLLTSCHFIDRARAADLKSVGIHTAEQLASLDDAALQRLGPGYRPLKEQAFAYCEEAKNAAPMMRLAAENSHLRDQVVALTAQTSEQARRIEALEREKLYQQPQGLSLDQQRRLDEEVAASVQGATGHAQAPFFDKKNLPDPYEAYRATLPPASVPAPAAQKPRRPHRRTRPLPTPDKPANQEQTP